MAHDTCLSTVVDVAAADDVGTDALLCPSLPLRLTDTVTLCLGTIFIFPVQPFVVVVWLFVFSKRNTGTLGI